MNYIASQNSAQATLDKIDLGGIELSSADNASYPLVLPATQGANTEVLVNDGSGNLTWGAGGGGGSGDVVGPASATNNAIALFDTTTGKLIKDSTVPLHKPTAASVFIDSTPNPSMTGASNIAIGSQALDSATIAQQSVAIGVSALTQATTEGANVAIGHFAFGTAIPGNSNVGVGANAGFASTGSNNVFLGSISGNGMTTGALNVFIGQNTDGVATGSNQIAIGQSAIATATNQCMLGNASLTEVVPNASANCNLGTDANPWRGLYLDPYLKAALPAVGSGGGVIYVSDATGASVTGSLCFSNGTSWIDVTTHIAVV